jgi:hypothetical protein
MGSVLLLSALGVGQSKAPAGLSSGPLYSELEAEVGMVC